MPDRQRRKLVIGIDNGTTGSIGVVGPCGVVPMFVLPPVKTEQDYTKKAQRVTRIDSPALMDLLQELITGSKCLAHEALAVLERPLVNPGMFKATGHALRCFEATLIALETWQIPHLFVDSKEWQRAMLPEGTKGTHELKQASKDLGIRLYPTLADSIQKHGDADGLIIAEWAWRKAL